MLILSRRIDEVVVIDHRIRVRVLSISGDRVRLGFEAPKDVPIDREEVWLQVPQVQATPDVSTSAA